MFSFDRLAERLPVRTSFRRLRRTHAVSVAAVLLLLGAASGEAFAAAGCLQLTGSYLIDVESGKSLSSRQVLTLTADGNAFVIDSNQGGVTGSFDPFSSEQGSWTCQSADRATATVLDFDIPAGSPKGQHLYRADYKITGHPATKTISGTIELRQFPFTANPLKHPLPTPIATFTFTGAAIK